MGIKRAMAKKIAAVSLQICLIAGSQPDRERDALLGIGGSLQMTAFQHRAQGIGQHTVITGPHLSIVDELGGTDAKNKYQGKNWQENQHQATDRTPSHGWGILQPPL